MKSIYQVLLFIQIEKKHKLPELVSASTISNFSYNEMAIKNYTHDSRLEVNVIK
jgi:hypothetical protein